MNRIVVKNINELPQAAEEFISKLGNNRVIAFYGNMGAGKTTFIKEICTALGVTDTVNSPTFAIINEYRKPDAGLIYHFDFYRINKTEEAYDFGYEDYFYSNELCLIEWPEKIASLLPENFLAVTIQANEDGERVIEF